MVDITGMVRLKRRCWLNLQLSATPAFLPFSRFIELDPCGYMRPGWHAHWNVINSIPEVASRSTILAYALWSRPGPVSARVRCTKHIHLYSDCSYTLIICLVHIRVDGIMHYVYIRLDIILSP